MSSAMNSNKFIVVTTINPVTEQIKEFKKIKGYNLVIVADKKTPQYTDSDLIFLDVKKQEELGLHSIETCPYNSYVRKNIGYLFAMNQSADLIAETDDDNGPLPGWGENIDFFPDNSRIVSSPKTFNIFSEFTDMKIWPRGFPLENICDKEQAKIDTIQNPKVGVWNGLVNGEPDVDAIYRLTIGKHIEFQNNSPLLLEKGVFAPFNSQNTFWQKEFFPYMYLPVTVEWRFSDILRGYVAQRCLWEHDAYLGFTGPTVIQKRNRRNYMKDFKDETQTYLLTKKVINLLSEIELSKSPHDNMVKVYSTLVKNGIVNETEMKSVENWISDVKGLGF